MPTEPASETAAPQRHSRSTAGTVIVAGMHRSGTSLLASVLGASGVHIGDDLLPPGPDNPLGYFEDTGFMYFHDRCLNRRGMGYADIDPGKVPVEFTAAEADEARGLIAARAAHGLWGWKDPRTCLFLGGWGALLPDARVVVPFRDPLAVLASLLRRHEARVLADPASGLELWRDYVRCTLAFLDSAHPGHVVFDADALFTAPEDVSRALASVSLEVAPETIRETADPAHYRRTVAASAFPALLRAACPEAASLFETIRGRSAVNDDTPVEPTPAAAAVEHAAEALGPGAARSAINALLLAALTAQDPTLAKKLDGFSPADRLAAEREQSRSQQGRILALEEQKKEIYLQLESERGSSKAHWDRAEALEARVRDLADEADAARSALGEAEQAAASAGATLDSARALLADAQGRAAATEAERDRALAELTEADAARRDALHHLHATEHRLREVMAERDEAVTLMQHYRRRWPPYAAKALARRARRYLKHRLRHRETPRQMHDMGLSARIAVLHTGMPRSIAETESVARALSAQSLRPARIVWPGEPDADTGEATHVQNWWGPDLPALLGETDIAVFCHPERYGPGPLWHAQQLEMIAAAFASDPLLAAMVFRGAPGEPTTGTPNHLYEVDAATIGQWHESTLAAAIAAPAAAESFHDAVRGEIRDLVPVLQHLVNAGRKVLIAPRSFPIEAADGDTASENIGRSLPAGPVASPADSGPIRALYVTQWIECGGADKGILDLVNRSDPAAVRWNLMTTAAAAQSWAPRVAGHVGEMIHLGDHLPLPPDERFPEFLAEYVRRRGIEVVHIMHSFQGYDAIPVLRRVCPGVKIVDQCHILEKPEFAGGGHPIYSTVNYQRLFDHRTVTNHWLARHLIDHHNVPEKDISVIYTCVDADEEFNPETYKPGSFRERLADQLPDDGPIIVFLGRLHEQKRPERFARVAALVTERRPDLRANFVMCGDGPLRREVRAERHAMRDPNRLILAGEVGHSGHVLRDADLMLMLSEREGLAYVSFEAMSMGVPQIFTDVNAQGELITPDAGTLIDPNASDLEERAAAEVIRLLDDRAAREAMGAAARNRIVGNFNIPVMVKAYEDLYIRLVGRTPAGRERNG